MTASRSANPAGFSFDMLLPTPGTPPALAEILQAEFADIGVTMTVTQTPAQGVADLFFNQQEGGAMLGVWSGRAGPDDREEAMRELVAAGTEEALDLVIYNPVSVQVATPRVAAMPTIIANGKFEFRGASVTPD